MNAMPFMIPYVADGDIDRMEQLLGVSFDAQRRDVLKCNESIDVQACPGSGKTTLLVAKLAILAGKWTESRRGICVLSHTNVARAQVEQKLATTAEGQRLLAYPHFIGTIHNFTNQFLALPRLRSEGAIVRVIDDAICGAKCRSLLHNNPQYMKAKIFLQYKKTHDPDNAITNLRYEGPDLDLGSEAGDLRCGKTTPSYAILKEIKEQVAGEGYWRYDDMFAIAAKQLKEWPTIVDLIRQRFRAVFIDEMQDTSDMQNVLVATLFPSGVCALQQRFGDSNQAIYDRGQVENTRDIFPCPGCLREIPNSKRFGPWIASVADPLACIPVTSTLRGEGPVGTNCYADPASMQHTIFLFDEGTCQEVLPAFACLLLDTFLDADLNEGLFRAIGHIGKMGEDQRHFPRSLHDYWSSYESDAGRPDPRPSTFAGYVHLAQRQRHSHGRSAEAVETVDRGIVEILYLVDPKLVNRRGRAHRWLQEALGSIEDDLNIYRKLIWRSCIEGQQTNAATWGNEAQGVRALLRPLIGEAWSDDADAFVQWSDAPSGGETLGAASQPAPPNVFRFTRADRSVDIQVGTIHSAKSQTHTATLVLETYYHEHDLADLLDWFCGNKRGWKKANKKRRGEHLRRIYTAMTRPSHLLCIAIRKSVFGNDLNACEAATTLRNKGWRIEDLCSRPSEVTLNCRECGGAP